MTLSVNLKSSYACVDTCTHHHTHTHTHMHADYKKRSNVAANAHIGFYVNISCLLFEILHKNPIAGSYDNCIVQFTKS